MTRFITLVLFGATIVLPSLAAPATDAPIKDLVVGKTFTVPRQSSSGFVHPANLGEGNWAVHLDNEGNQVHTYNGPVVPVNDAVAKNLAKQPENGTDAGDKNLAKRWPTLGPQKNACSDGTTFAFRNKESNDPNVWCANYNMDALTLIQLDAQFSQLCGDSGKQANKATLYSNYNGVNRYWCNYWSDTNICDTGLASQAYSALSCACPDNSAGKSSTFLH